METTAGKGQNHKNLHRKVTRRNGRRSRNLLGEIHIHRSGHNPIIPGIAPIAPVVGRPTADIVDHAAEQVDLPPLVRGFRGGIAHAAAAVLIVLAAVFAKMTTTALAAATAVASGIHSACP